MNFLLHCGGKRLAERVRFELTVVLPTHAFQACALNHSAISPPKSGAMCRARAGRATRILSSRGVTVIPLALFRERVNYSGVRILGVILLLLLTSVGAWARFGIVRTTDGRTLQGQVRFTPDRVVVVNAELGSIWGVALTNITLISFPTNSLSNTATESGDGALPTPWREAGIGYSRLPGSVRHEGGIFTLRSAGMNIDGEADAFHYVFKPVRGDSEIVAEVVSIQYTHPFAKAGLMMRESLNEYSRHVMLALTAERGGALQFRADERAAAQSSALRAIYAPTWLKLKRQSNDFTAYVSPNGRLWSVLEKISVPMNQNIYVGLAVAGGRDNVLNWTTFSKVREAPKLQNDFFSPEVELVSGSTITSRPAFADDNEVTFVGAPKIVSVPVSRVARIAFQPLNGDMAWKTRISRPGVWVTTGDFFDGDFRGIEGRKLTISSVLYGLRTFEIDDEVLAVVLQPRRQQRALYEVETADGAMLLATQLAVGDGELRLHEAALGEVRVPMFEILEVRRR
jgi:hypothetical protein